MINFGLPLFFVLWLNLRYKTILIKNKKGLKWILNSLFLGYFPIKKYYIQNDKLRQTTQHKYATIKVEVMNMQENYLKSLRMIKVLKIKTRREYIKLMNDYLLLSVESLKYISQKESFRLILRQAKEVK